MQNGVNNASAAVQNINPLHELVSDVCVIQSTWTTTFYTLGQSLVYLTIGLIVAAFLFTGLSAMAMMIFRELKGSLDHVFASGGSVGNGDGGAGMAMAKSLGNRVAGAALAAGGAMAGSPQIAAAGMKAVASGRNAAGEAVAGFASHGAAQRSLNASNAARDERNQQTAQREQTRLSERAADKAERAEQTSQREAKNDAKQAARDKEATSNQDKGKGSRTDPAGSKSGGREASQQDSGATSSRTYQSRGAAAASQSGSGTANPQDGGAVSSRNFQSTGAAASQPGTLGGQSASTAANRGNDGKTIDVRAVPQKTSGASSTSGATSQANGAQTGGDKALPAPASSAPQSSAASNSNEALEEELGGAAVGAGAVMAAESVADSGAEAAPASGTASAAPAPAAGSNEALERELGGTVTPGRQESGEINPELALEEQLTGAPGLESELQAERGNLPQPTQTAAPGGSQDQVQGVTTQAALAGDTVAATRNQGGAVTNTPAPSQTTTAQTTQAAAAQPATQATGGTSRAADDQAVQAAYQQLNSQGGTYYSPSQVRYAMERQGKLPSQQAENDRRTATYAGSQNVSEAEARQALQARGGFVHQGEASTPLPPAYRSEADYNAVAARMAERHAPASQEAAIKEEMELNGEIAS